ncbi:MAG: xanthine dehydrogenase small subunit [Piscinibacter sp.]|nr:xanthine dehydrogenase small subunit [Piscinibacter sp.]
MSTRPIRFFHRGQIVEVDDAAPTRSVLDWLREDAHCTGTKEGCNEGDCGACTVVVGELDAGGQLQLATTNACIQFLPTLDGKALFTVEDLKSPEGALHPVQQAMVECHGSQCGFCTPGFVMSMWSLYQHHQGRPAGAPRPTRRELADELSGNLCRCTGYRPILDAGERMFELPAVPFEAAPVVEALQSLRPPMSFGYGRGAGFHAPRTLDELAALRERLPQARLLAGSTDIGLWVNKQFRDVGTLIYVGAVEELRRIEPREDGGLWIGAAASLEDAWQALAQRHPALTETWLRFASPPIRRAGTMGGNVANGSPIGDSAPVLMALDAQIELRRGERVRTMDLTEFYVDYMKNRLEAGEFVQALRLPALPATRQVRAYKISKRFDCDISALLLAASIELDGDTVRSVRLAYGGMAAIVKRATTAEAALVGRPWTEAAAATAAQALEQDFKPLTDMRASAAYRMQVAQNLLQRFWLETRHDAPLPIAQTSVFAIA